MKHPEIKCPLCRIGFGGIKAENTAPKKKWYQLKGVEPTYSFIHLDLFWSYESGLIRDCADPEHLKLNVESIDDNGNPKFNDAFAHKMKELRDDFLSDPSDIDKSTFPFDDFYIAFVECLNYGSVDGEDEEYDRSLMTEEQLKALYDSGKNLKESLRFFIKPCAE